MIKKIAKWTAYTFGAFVLLVGVAYGGMRLSDGPVEFFPWFTISIGGPFRSGELAASPDNWDFIKDREEIEFQTLNPTTSRTIWVPVIDGKLYVVSGYMNSTIGRVWKQWPSYMEQDNRILLRVDDDIYEQRLNRITEGPITAAVMSEVARKYFGAPAQVNPAAGAAVTSGSAWLFEVVDN
ncbi:MAG: hypothetical protein HOF74_10820 [Gammaproteobacteria bacterium]|mgnify:FL=1|jgi:hypothetical protein|nr:hypothetical protein [Gammaproteobacteria bacterium]MBT3860315.1 hypothetical protein [Gammaproteobacteria bacterium]MBT3987607.1 hypothetical protein [Gammaproteobacteria bacterium]MBT4256843.1 hypothetical protein [Gammaproteobacteria bacterium]MBT4582227.1 hypothetical protein [Gammaproteobacteria bacterium]